MAETLSKNIFATGWRRFVPDLPLVVWMVLLTLAIGFGGGLNADQVIAEYNRGFGRALGEFALILLPSFTLAAVLSRQNVVSETAYAALSPASGRCKMDAAFGAFAGFKLLYSNASKARPWQRLRQSDLWLLRWFCPAGLMPSQPCLQSALALSSRSCPTTATIGLCARTHCKVNEAKGALYSS